MATHRVKIEEAASGSLAMVSPGILLADVGDTIEFNNATGFQVALLFADGGILDGVGSMQTKLVNKGVKRAFTITTAAKPDSIYEYVVSVKLQSGRRVFAIGGSTPKIIIRPSSSSQSAYSTRA